MEDLSKFITEELFLVGTTSSKKEVSSPTEKTTKKELAIIAPDLNKVEEGLLVKILSATKIPSSEIIRLEKFNAKAAKHWLVFSDEKHAPTHGLRSYEISVFEDCKIILAQPLSIIAGSQDLKQKLWTSIRTLFRLAKVQS